jgi:hypothetical protein
VYASTSRTAFRVVQPWGPDKARQSTLISEHATAAEAFREIDRLVSEMMRTGAPSDAVELVVVDPDDHVVRRPEVH